MTLFDHAVVGGVFRDRDTARRAVDELRQAGFPEDQIAVADRKGRFVSEGPAPVPHTGRTLVTVRAPGRYEEASAILRRHGGTEMLLAQYPPRDKLCGAQHGPTSASRAPRSGYWRGGGTRRAASRSRLVHSRGQLWSCRRRSSSALSAHMAHGLPRPQT